MKHNLKRHRTNDRSIDYSLYMEQFNQRNFLYSFFHFFSRIMRGKNMSSNESKKEENWLILARLDPNFSKRTQSIFPLLNRSFVTLNESMARNAIYR